MHVAFADACKYDCGAHGFCDSKSKLCTCNPGWSGSSCQNYRENQCIVACEVRCSKFKNRGMFPAPDAVTQSARSNLLLDFAAVPEYKTKEGCVQDCLTTYCKTDYVSILGTHQTLFLAVFYNPLSCCLSTVAAPHAAPCCFAVLQAAKICSETVRYNRRAFARL